MTTVPYLDRPLDIATELMKAPLCTCTLYCPHLIVCTAIWTDLSRNLNEELTNVIAGTGDFWKSQDQGAATMLVAGFDPALDSAKGVYLSDCQICMPADHVKYERVAERLWELSDELVGLEERIEGKSEKDERTEGGREGSRL
jgi:hypothetical protein